MMIEMASDISKKCTYKCVDHLRHNIFNEAKLKAKCAQ